MKKLNPSFIPKFKNQLEKLPVFAPSFLKREDNINHHYSVDACEFYQQILPEGFNKTKVWGFAGFCKDEKSKKVKYVKHSPGPTFEVERDINTNIQWNNKILGEYMFKIDKTINWANPNNISNINSFDHTSKECQWPPTLAMHVHGISVPPIYDGNPRSWYTATGIKGPIYSTNYFKYTNEQRSSMLWYYEQSPGVSRYSVYSGLCGLYFIKDEKYNLPKDSYHIPLLIQDKSFYEDGSLFYDEKTDSNHPYWRTKFYGDTILVNGKVWPNLTVENQMYRFSVVNGSNSRAYKIALDDNSQMIQIGSDGGYIYKPQELSYFVLYPGERIDLLIDFSKYREDDEIIMKNLFSKDECEDIMKFTVIKASKKLEYYLPKSFMKYPPMKINSKKISSILYERKKDNYIDGYFINNETYLNPPNIIIKVGSTFIWEFINLCEEDVCMHVHLTNFQILERQKINMTKYKEAYEKNKELIFNEDEFCEALPIAPNLYEEGFKDTLHCPSSFITRIIIRYAPTYVMEEVKVGENYFSFNTSDGPEYIINSQILEQKDNYMVRPQIIISEE